MPATEPDCPNPLLLQFVKEWLDAAREKNSKGITTYKHAYDSLKACPIPFQHPAELQQLKGFGPKLCERLTTQLQKHCLENELPMPEHPQARKARGNVNGGDGEDEAPAVKKKARKPKAYVPAFRSGAYALVLALSSQAEDVDTGMTKTELIGLAQNHCDSSFEAPSDPTKFYTAWNSMKTLVSKELVYERGRPLRRYGLTDEGWDVARRIRDTTQFQAENGSATSAAAAAAAVNQPSTSKLRDREPFCNANTMPQNIFPSEPLEMPHPTLAYQAVVADGPAVADDSSLPSFTPIRLSPGSFTVQFVLDVREVRAKTDRDYMQEELAKQGIRAIMRSLELGDAQWIAKVNDPDLLSRLGADGDEVVLDWIVERKRLDDLIGSIKDGRFHEQKFRLKRSGVKKVIYLIEEIAMDQAAYSKYEEAVHSAIASTQVVNGYFVKRTAKMDETIKYLVKMTKMLKKTYESRTLNVVPTQALTAQNYLPLMDHLRARNPSEGYYITYPAFASLASKSESMTLRDVFLKMMMTTRGVTGERALAIQKKWKTPYDFVKAFEACGSGEAGKKRKQDMVFNGTPQLVGRKKISKVLSQKIAEIWGDT